MTQEEINNTVVDVIFNDSEILHVLPPNESGVRGINNTQYIIRNKIGVLKGHLRYNGYSVAKIDAYETELRNENL